MVAIRGLKAGLGSVYAISKLSLAQPAPKMSAILLDGGMGEELIRRGVPYDHKIWTANAIQDAKFHEIVLEAHRAFINAGSSFITAHNFGVTPGVGFTASEVEKLTAEAGRLAQVARNGMKDAEYVTILGSLPPLLESYRPDKVFPFEEGRTWYTRIAEALNPYVDGFLAETLSSTEEMMQALAAARLLEKPFYGSFTVGENGLLRSGESFDMAIQLLLDEDGSSGSKQRVLKAILLNCSTPEAIQKALEGLKLKGSAAINAMHEHGVLLGAYANRLTPVPEGIDFNTYKIHHKLHEEYIAEMKKCFKSQGLLASYCICNDDGGHKAID